MKDQEIELIEMKYFENRSHHEIATILDISEVNAKVRLHRAIKKLKDTVINKVRHDK